MLACQTVSESLFEVKCSKFITFLVPINCYESFLVQLKEAHPKARHFVMASRTYNIHDQVQEQFSDDQEPKGTGGMPLLNVLRGEGVMNSAIIVVRYFGGTKLGTGGLVRAYTQAAKMVLAKAELKPYIKRNAYYLSCEYQHEKRVNYFCEKEAFLVMARDYKSEHVVFNIYLSEEELQKLEQLKTYFKLELHD